MSRKGLAEDEVTREGLRVLHWNVFEDGLTDAPGSLSFSPEFSAQFSALLQVQLSTGCPVRLRTPQAAPGAALHRLLTTAAHSIGGTP